MAEIVMTAAPYCYGPTSKLLCVAEDLARSHSVIYVGMEPGLSLAKQGPFARVIEVCDRDSWNAEARDALRHARCLVAFLEYRSLKLAASLGVPSLFFDTLAWLRTEPPPFTTGAHAYVAQNYFRTPPLGLIRQLNHFYTVGPVFARQLDQLSVTARINSGLRILVNFGGLLSPVMRPEADCSYVSWVMRMLQGAIPDPSRLTICLPMYLSWYIDTLQAAMPDAYITCPGMAEFHAHLSESSALITVPGLETVYEAMYLGRPLIFLPPYNGTQVLQLAEYRRRSICLASLAPPHLSEVDVDTTDPSRLTAEVQQLNKYAADDESLCQALSASLTEAIISVAAFTEAQEQVIRNRQTIHDLGMEGRRSVVDIIIAHCQLPASVGQLP